MNLRCCTEIAILLRPVYPRRHDTKSLTLRNATPLPAAWRLVGVDKLGEEFGVEQDRGVVPPRSDFSLQMHFRSAKATNLKRAVSLEVRRSRCATRGRCTAPG